MLLLALSFAACQGPSGSFLAGGDRSVVSFHGPLSVAGNRIVDARGEAVSLVGNSLPSSNSGGNGDRFYHGAAVDYLKDERGSTLIRIAMGVETPGGYLDDPEGNGDRVERMVDAAIRAGIYVIVGWHSHEAEAHTPEAIGFFQRMARRYGHQPNVIYEISHTPIELDWGDAVKPDAEAVIAAIRQIDSDNLIVVGTPRGSQDVDVASADPIDGASNIVYGLRFQIGSDGEELREKVRRALGDGAAIMVTDWGTVDADDGGPLPRDNAEAWFSFLRENHISHVHGVVDLNDEDGASNFLPETPPEVLWDDADLTDTGRDAREILRGWDETL